MDSDSEIIYNENSDVQKSCTEASEKQGVLYEMKRKHDERSAEKKRRSRLAKRIALPIVCALLFVFVLNMLILPLTGSCQRVERVIGYTGDNQYLTAFGKGTLLSAHRAGGDLAPEETKAAFELCMATANVDIVEFDLHLTKDGHLVLMHDHEVDRTSDGPIVFGKKGVKVQDKTLDELRQLNFGYNFQDPVTGEYVYRKEGANLDKVRILTLEEILNYLEAERSDGSLNYIIEIKDKGSVGKRAMDKLYAALTDENHYILDRTIVGTFNGDISKYIDDTYKQFGVKRSAGILEVLNFYFAFLWGVRQSPDKLEYDVLQIPMGLDGFYDFSTKAFIDYAHSHGIAVQYWTINDPEDMAKLQQNGADAIMTDNPELAYSVLRG